MHREVNSQARSGGYLFSAQICFSSPFLVYEMPLNPGIFSPLSLVWPLGLQLWCGNRFCALCPDLGALCPVCSPKPSPWLEPVTWPCNYIVTSGVRLGFSLLCFCCMWEFGQKKKKKSVFSFSFCLFVWLSYIVLYNSCGTQDLSVVSCRITVFSFLFSCGIWDLVPRPGMKPSPPALEGRVLATGPPGKYWDLFFL